MRSGGKESVCALGRISPAAWVSPTSTRPGKPLLYTYCICIAKTQYLKCETNIPGKGIARPQSQVPHSCACERFIYSNAILLKEIWSWVNEAAQFLFWEFLMGFSLQCGLWLTPSLSWRHPLSLFTVVRGSILPTAIVQCADVWLLTAKSEIILFAFLWHNFPCRRLPYCVKFSLFSNFDRSSPIPRSVSTLESAGANSTYAHR